MSPCKTLVIAVFVSLAAGACSGPDQPGSPLTPTASDLLAPTSSSSSPAAPTANGATIDGLIAGTTPVAAAFRAGASTVTVAVAGTSINALVNADGRFVLTGVPPGDIQLQFTGGGVDCTLTIAGVQDKERITVRIVVTGTTATLESEHRIGTDQKVEIEGALAAVSAAAMTLEVAGTQILVPADAVIRHGSTTLLFGDLRAGMRVHVKGAVNGAVVTAREIMVQNGFEQPKTETELTGWISAVVAGCPKPVFQVGGVSVTTTSAAFQHGDCSDVKVGSRVVVKGTAQAVNTLAASRVSFDEIEVDVRGTISAVSGCPTPTLTVNGTVFVVTASTEFKEGVCADLKVGTDVKVKGTQQADGSVRAYWIWPEVKWSETPAEVTGVVSSLSGACPNLTFDLTSNGLRTTGSSGSSRRVLTTKSTTFLETTCAVLKKGDLVYVKGTTQGSGCVEKCDTRVTATIVKRKS